MRRLLIGILCCWNFPAHAGAWLMPEGEGLAITQLTHFTSDSYWDARGARQSQDRFSKWEIQPYVEYGLTPNLTIGGSAYLQQVQQGGDKNRGIADPELFLRTIVWQRGAQVVSLQPLIKLPSRFEHNESNPRGGSASTDAELSLLYGHSLHLLSDRDYLDARIGYRERTGNLNGQFKADIALGLSPSQHWQLIPAARYVRASIPEATPAFSESGELDYDLLKAELTIAYKLPSGNWLQATCFDHVSGVQTGDGRGLSLGYAVRF